MRISCRENCADEAQLSLRGAEEVSRIRTVVREGRRKRRTDLIERKRALASDLQSYDDVLTHFTAAGSTLGPVVTFDSVSIRRMLGLLLPVT